MQHKKPFLFLTIFGVFLSVSALAQPKNFIDQPYLEVSGYADTLVVPDKIFLKIILSEKDTKDKIPLEEQENKMLAGLRNLGINTEKDLSVSDLASNYKVYLLKQKGILKTKEYLLHLASANTVTKVFITLEELGIANVSVAYVSHSAMEQLQNLCRAKAVLNARNKALALTKPLSQSIGNAIHIEEPTPVSALQGKVAGISLSERNNYDKETYEVPSIDFEKIIVSATVNVVFTLK